MVVQAIRENRLLRIVYRSRTNPASHERLVEPQELLVVRGDIYLRAYCHLRREIRSFVLNKIEMMELI